MTEGMISGLIFIKKSCEAKLEFEIVIPGSAIRHTIDWAMEPGKIKFSGFPQITPVLANLISNTLIRPMVKIKIENFQVFDIQWLYRTYIKFCSSNTKKYFEECTESAYCTWLEGVLLLCAISDNWRSHLKEERFKKTMDMIGRASRYKHFDWLRIAKKPNKWGRYIKIIVCEPDQEYSATIGHADHVTHFFVSVILRKKTKLDFKIFYPCDLNLLWIAQIKLHV